MGFNAANTLMTGDSNVIIGYEADVNDSNALNRIVIGSRAIGFRDSTVVLGDSLTIQTTYLHGDININRKYTIPKVDGNKGNVLRTDGDGTVTWDSTSIDDLHDVLLKDSSIFLGTEPLKINNARNNTAMGIKVFNNVTDGKNNTIMGFNAANTLMTGDSNVIIGYEADVNDSNALNRIVIGSRANGFRDSTVVIGDSSTIQTTYLFGNVSISRAYILPKTGGKNGQVLKYPSSGKILEWGEGGSSLNKLSDAKVEDSSIYIGSLTSNSSSTAAAPLRNVSVGFNTLDSVTTGNRNIAIGFESLKNNTTANHNIAIGYQSLKNNKIGIGNIATGAYALFNDSVGIKLASGNLNDTNTPSYSKYGNIAYGTRALYTNTTGQNNVAIGTSAMDSTTTGYDNIAVGHGALQKNTRGYENTAIGYQSLSKNTTGWYNTAIGHRALYNSTSNDNTAIGNFSLGSTTTGNQNTGVGVWSLYSNTTGAANVAIGWRSLQNNTTSVQNTAVGYLALRKNKTGHSNVAIGGWSLANNTEGSNVAVGYQSLKENTTGKYNVGTGTESLMNNKTGTGIVAIGYRALYNDSVGIKLASGNLKDTNTPTYTSYGNIAYGTRALYTNTTGQNNIAIGTSALDSTTTGGDNIAIGHGALQKNTTAINNVAIGHEAADTITDGDSNVIIGSQADTSSSSSNNEIVIGTAATGQGDNTVTIGNNNIKQWLPGSNKNVDLGKNNKRFNKLYIDSVTVYNKMGIGRNNPDEALHVQSVTSGQSVHIKCQSTHANKNFVQLGATFNDRNRIYSRKMNSNNEVDECALYVETGDAQATGSAPKGNAVMTFWPGGKVGINTGLGNDPQYRLKVVGAIRCDSLLIADSFILPSTRGTSGQVLQYPSSGNTLEWTTLSSAGATSLNGLSDVNVNIGSNSLYIGNDPSGNTGFSSAERNISIGLTALEDITTGDDNVAIGHNALQQNETGIHNVAIGNNSLKNNTENYTTAVGSLSLEENTTGAHNTALGYATLQKNKFGQNNCAVGFKSLNVLAPSSAANGQNNTAIGSRVLEKLTSGIDNTAIGFSSLFQTTTASGNTGTGAYSLYNNTGNNNTAFGYNTLKLKTSGNENTACGYLSLLGQSGSTGQYNTGIGARSLEVYTSGNHNVGVGYQAGDVITTGSENVIIGSGSDPSANNGSNQIVIGYNVTGTGNNEIALGNTSISAIKAQVTSITAYSDIRIKKNITNSDLGLDFIKQLRPVKYNKVNPAEYPDEILEKKFKGDNPDEKPEDDLQVYHGLVAQEVKQVLDNAGKTWDGHSINKSDGKQGIAYGALTVPLIKAVQELSEENNTLKEKNTNLENRVSELETQLAAIKAHLGI
jgi:hypothetical protein